MPNLGEMVEKFETWWGNGGRVQVNWEGLAAAIAGQNLITAQVDGRVLSVHPEGERTLVFVGQVGQNNSVIRMYLSAECIFQNLPHPGNEEAFANLESRIRIAFPNGEHCFVHFFHPPS